MGDLAQTWATPEQKAGQTKTNNQVKIKSKQRFALDTGIIYKYILYQINTYLNKGHLFHTSSIFQPSPVNQKNQNLYYDDKAEVIFLHATGIFCLLLNKM